MPSSPAAPLRSRSWLGALGVVLLAAGLNTPAQASTSPSTHYTVEHAQDYRTNKQVVVRWNPCVAIKYKINPGALGSAGVTELQNAVAQLSKATGMTFTYAGTTAWVPKATAATTKTYGGQTFRSPDYAAQTRATGVHFVIAFTKKGGSNLYTGSELGQGGTYYQSSNTSGLRVTDAFALVRSDSGLPGGFGAGAHRGNLELHELGHAVALDHYSDPNMIMNPSLNAHTPAGYASGDRAGLAKVGRPAGCIS